MPTMKDSWHRGGACPVCRTSSGRGKAHRRRCRGPPGGNAGDQAHRLPWMEEAMELEAMEFLALGYTAEMRMVFVWGSGGGWRFWWGYFKGGRGGARSVKFLVDGMRLKARCTGLGNPEFNIRRRPGAVLFNVTGPETFSASDLIGATCQTMTHTKALGTIPKPGSNFLHNLL